MASDQTGPARRAAQALSRRQRADRRKALDLIEDLAKVTRRSVDRVQAPLPPLSPEEKDEEITEALRSIARTARIALRHTRRGGTRGRI